MKASFKTLLRCRCVCKTWRSLISQPYFINVQLLKSHRNHQINDYVIFSKREYGSKTFHFHALNDHMTKKLEFPMKTAFGFWHPVPFASLCPSSTDFISFEVLGSCNGLLCLFSREGVILWNPAINKVRVVDEPYCGYLVSAGGLCFIPQTGDFKVVTLKHSSIIRPPEVTIYSTETNLWKEAFTRDTRCWAIRQKCPTPFVGGALHWCAHRAGINWTEQVILCFDALEEAFHEIVVPAEKGLKRIVEFQGTIACFLDDTNGLSWEVWVMKDYGVAESWTKLCTLGYSRGSPLVMMNDGEVMLTCADGDFFLFDPTKENCRREFEAKPGCRDMVTYKGSLALIDEDNLSIICPYCCPRMIVLLLCGIVVVLVFFLHVLTS